MRTISKALPACMLVMLVGVGTAAAQGTSSTSETTTTTSKSTSTNKTKAQGQYGGTSYGGTTSAQATPKTGHAYGGTAYGGATYGAQTTPSNEVQPTYTEEQPAGQSTLERYGFAVMLGGGGGDWKSSRLRSDTGITGLWDVRLAFGTRWPVAVEVSYIGSVSNINILGLDSNARLLGNGAQGVGRINIFDWNIQPFLFGGAAWTHYSLENTSIRTSAVDDTDDVLEVPAGLGINWKYRGFLLDIRGEYRFAFFDNMFNNLNGSGSTDMARWNGNANLGYAW